MEEVTEISLKLFTSKLDSEHELCRFYRSLQEKPLPTWLPPVGMNNNHRSELLLISIFHNLQPNVPRNINEIFCFNSLFITFKREIGNHLFQVVGSSLVIMRIWNNGEQFRYKSRSSLQTNTHTKKHKHIRQYLAKC